MKQEQKLTELIQVWDNKDKAQAIKVLKASMAASKTVKVDMTEVKSYVKHAITEGLDGNTLPDYPSDFSSASRSSYYKQAIQAAAQEIEEVLHINNSSEILTLTWKNCKESATLVDFRKNLKLYLVAIRTEFYTEEDVQELTDMVDELDRENRKLREYKRIQDELFGIMTEADESVVIVRQANKLKSLGLTDKEICTTLNIDRNKLNYARRKAEFISVDGFVENEVFGD